MTDKDKIINSETPEEQHKRFWNSWLSPEDGIRLKHIRDYVRGLWRNQPDLRYYPPHNDSHSKKVEDNMHLLIPNDKYKKLNESERFLLLASAWLHDVGMIKGILKKDDSLSDEQIRKDHEKRSVEFITNKHSELNLSRAEIAALRHLIENHVSHALIDDCPHSVNIENRKIRLQLLASYLRLADAIHLDETRIDNFLYRIYRSEIPVSSQLHWVIPKMISGICPNPETHAIEVSLLIPERWKETKIHIPIREMIREGLESEIELLKNHLVKGEITIYLDVKIEEIETTTFTKEEEKDIHKIINSINILRYPNATMLINDIYTTMLRLCRKKDNEQPEIIIEQIRDYLIDTLKENLEKRFTHIGAISTAKEFLSKVTNVVNHENTDKMKLLHEIEKEIKNRLNKKDQDISMIRKFAKEIFSDDDVENILVYGFSSTVLSVLSDITNKDKREIYVAECRNKTIYAKNDNDIVYNDGFEFASKISKIGFKKVYLISDASVAHYMANKAIKKVLCGANGVIRGKGDLHSVGHLMVALLATKFKIPFYVATETIKYEDSFDEKLIYDQERENSWFGEDLSWRKRLDKDKIELKKPRNDIVPYELITAFITENGIEWVT